MFIINLHKIHTNIAFMCKCSSMKVAILSDQINGHLNQSLGIIKLLESDYEVNVEIINIRLKNHYLRSIHQFILKHLGNNLNKKNAEKIISFYKPFEFKDFDLIVSTGGKLAALNAALAKKYSIYNIQNGSLRGNPTTNYSANIVDQISTEANGIFALIPPNKYMPIKLKKRKNKALFLIGGNGSGYKIKKKDINVLCFSIEKFVKEGGLQPIIITSRRTKKSHERIMKDNLFHLLDQQSVWFNDDRKSTDLNRYFEKSELIFVTEDSSMMIAESISSGLPVNTIAPIRRKKSRQHTEMLQRYEIQGFIKRLNFSSDFHGEAKKIASGYEKIMNIKLDLKMKIFEKINLYSFKSKRIKI